MPRPVALSFRSTAAVSAGVLAAAAVALVSRRSDVLGAAVGMALAGLTAVITGALVMVVSDRRRRQGVAGESPRALLGLSCALWGVGQLLLSLDTAGTGARSFGPGDVISILAAPAVVLAMLTMPRRSRASRPGMRLVLDVLLLATAITLGVWWFVVGPLLSPAALAGAAVAPAVLVAVIAQFGDLLVVSLCLLVWLRDRRPGTAVLTVGAALQAIADIASHPAVIGGDLIPWESGAIWCLAWPIIGIGVMRIPIIRGIEPESVLEDLGESHTTTTATVVALLVVAGLVAAPGPHRWTGVDGALLPAVLVLLVLRELLGSSIRARLITRLGSEALRDALTGLPNRRALTARVRALDLSRPWVMLTVDLDGFKEVNDLLGHKAGDELIGAVATVLDDHCPPGGMVARIGGDEFGVLALGDIQDGERLAERLRSAVRTVPAAQDAGVALSASIGVGRIQLELDDAPDERSGMSRTSRTSRASGTSGAAPGAAEAASHRPAARHMPALLDPRHDRLVALVESAAALRAAKASGRDRIAVYPGAVEQARQRRLVIEWRLREALEDGLLQMHAQPLVDLRTGRVRGFESLARWTDELLGPVSPAEFVPVAEQVGLVTALGDFALRSTLEEARTHHLFGRDVEMGVNVSPIQLRLPRFASLVTDLLDEFALAPDRLLLEVTEAILVDEDDPAAGTLAELAAAGVRLAIDDFGTGYSALGYLRRLPLDVLKIDRSWVVDAVSDRRTRHIVSGVVDLAHQLGATVVMEGVEDAVTADMCVELGADTGQGWHFGRPKPWAAAAATMDVAARRD